MPRLFIAVVPPEEVLEAVAALPRPSLEGLRWTDREQWHATLRFLGRVDAAEPVVEALSSIGLPGAEAVAGPEVCRFGQRVLHVPVTGLEDVAGAVVRATAGLGQPPEDRPFAGHLTLARVRKGSRVDLRSLCGAAISGCWPVAEVCLIESHLSSAGARYEVAHRFPMLD
jgi:2'-5' RNA ligase